LFQGEKNMCLDDTSIETTAGKKKREKKKEKEKE
jgi:hypothetical protein